MLNSFISHSLETGSFEILPLSFFRRPFVSVFSNFKLKIVSSLKLQFFSFKSIIIFFLIIYWAHISKTPSRFDSKVISKSVGKIHFPSIKYPISRYCRWGTYFPCKWGFCCIGQTKGFLVCRRTHVIRL